MAELSFSPMHETKLSELDDFLHSEACDEETLSVEEAHGYLTALLLSGETLPTDWAKSIWGEPRYTDAQQEQHMLQLLGELREDIVASLNQQMFEPLLVEYEEDGLVTESYEGWCFGFMLGVEQGWEQWQEQGKEVQDLILPIARIALLMDEDSEDMDEEEYQQWVELIPGAVAGLYARMQ